jgi:hypothetical protein
MLLGMSYEDNLNNKFDIDKKQDDSLESSLCSKDDYEE